MKDQFRKHLARIYLILFAVLFSAGPGAAFEASLRVESGELEMESALANTSLVMAAKRDGVTNPQEILAAARADYGRLVGALSEQGYFGPTVSILVDGREAGNIPAMLALSQVLRIEVVVATGPAFEFGATEIAPLVSTTALPTGFRTGAAAKTPVISEAARVSLAGWRAIGHAVAQIDQQDIIADHRQARLDVRLRIKPGPRVRFGALNISGAPSVRESRIREIAAIPSGAVFDPTVLERAAARLRTAGAFSSVTLREAETLGQDDTMDVNLSLVEATPRRFGFGAALQSAEGLTLSGFWMHRNLLGGAERFRIEGEVSGLGGETNGPDYQLRAGLTRPSTFNRDTDLFFIAELEQLDEPYYLSRQASAEVGVSRYFSETLSAEAALSYRFSDVEDSLGTQQFSHLALPLALTRDRRDDPLNPASGTYLHTEIMPFFGLGDSASGGRGYLDARVYRSVGAEDGIVFAGRLQFGSVVGASIADTPPDLLFFSGGSGTVRGHSYQSLALQSGAVKTGGRSFLGFAGEARVRMSETITAVAFYDTGYIGANSLIDSEGSWHSGAGLGLRYQTGIGPIRLDVATPVTGSSANSVQIYIGIGQAF